MATRLQRTVYIEQQSTYGFVGEEILALDDTDVGRDGVGEEGGGTDEGLDEKHGDDGGRKGGTADGQR